MVLTEKLQTSPASQATSGSRVASTATTPSSSTTDGTNSSKVLVGAVVGSVIAFIIILIFMLWCRKRRTTKFAPNLKPNPKFELDTDKSLFEQANELPYSMQWEFPRKFLSFTKMLGSGSFGQHVWMAEAFEIGGFRPRQSGTRRMKPKRRSQGITVRYKSHFDTIGYNSEDKKVAVKTLKEDSTQADYMDLACELKILIEVGEHRNIVNLLGACTKGGNLSVILEYCPNGTLVNYLRKRRDIFVPEWDMIEEKFTLLNLLDIVQQILRGMEYLKSKQCHHLNLAGHNILVGCDNVMKISDFGRPRDLSKENVFLILTQGPDRHVSSKLPLAVKWMAPESVIRRTDTDKRSDVWSFGVVLWEIFSLGEAPYPGITNEEMVAFIQDERRMTCPKHCPKDIYGLMVDCWQTVSCERPEFSQIAVRVDTILKQNAPSYVEEIHEEKSTMADTPGSSVIHLPAVETDYYSMCALYNDG